ncbi:MAG: membrane protein insertion efficiency factor YidD [Roseimicrobium sp.]
MKTLVRLAIRGYQRFLSPAIHAIGGPGSGCRFTPTCSEYFLNAVERYGVGKGSWLGVRRLARCHPWGGSGHDPVPEPPLGSSDAALHGSVACQHDPCDATHPLSGRACNEN